MGSSRPDVFGEAFIKPLVPSLQVGAATGVGGFLVGGAIGTLRSAHPGLIAAFTGTQFFVLGGSFLYTRQALLKLAFSERTIKADLISSTAAGAVSGAAAGAFYGKVNSITGAFVFGTIGHLGQRYVHAQAGSKPTTKDDRRFLERLADSKWVPFKSIPNHQYEQMLMEKLLKVDAEISMIDEKIIVLRQEPGADSTRQDGT